MTDATTTEQTAPEAQAAPKRARRWPWIVALAVVAALGITGTSLGSAAAANADAQLAAVQDDYIDLETRAGILESSLGLIRDHRDRLEVQLEEQTAELEALRAQVGEPTAPAQQ